MEEVVASFGVLGRNLSVETEEDHGNHSLDSRFPG
jgi:hypothetical protein